MYAGCHVRGPPAGGVGLQRLTHQPTMNSGMSCLGLVTDETVSTTLRSILISFCEM